ncbi:hypothetical protein B0T21DRAFT_352845 [Apiosordaria backusii]|uniref:Uncharacterized protein n=1 Tax=Apiosordaria backusii TaxID=314023 RepID=A0AA40DQZ5_9PEZI|nr:hypothetical protein B0T21DRAFT_352845 [Apiosordaria backusii]
MVDIRPLKGSTPKNLQGGLRIRVPLRVLYHEPWSGWTRAAGPMQPPFVWAAFIVKGCGNALKGSIWDKKSLSGPVLVALSPVMARTARTLRGGSLLWLKASAANSTSSRVAQQLPTPLPTELKQQKTSMVQFRHSIQGQMGASVRVGFLRWPLLAFREMSWMMTLFCGERTGRTADGAVERGLRGLMSLGGGP